MIVQEKVEQLLKDAKDLCVNSYHKNAFSQNFYVKLEKMIRVETKGRQRIAHNESDIRKFFKESPEEVLLCNMNGHKKECDNLYDALEWYEKYSGKEWNKHWNGGF